jgi:hypothetical protein
MSGQSNIHVYINDFNNQKPMKASSLGVEAFNFTQNLVQQLSVKKSNLE